MQQLKLGKGLFQQMEDVKHLPYKELSEKKLENVIADVMYGPMKVKGPRGKVAYRDRSTGRFVKGRTAVKDMQMFNPTLNMGLESLKRFDDAMKEEAGNFLKTQASTTLQQQLSFKDLKKSFPGLLP